MSDATLWGMAATVADGWFRRQVVNPCEAFYLYFAASDGKHDGALMASTGEGVSGRWELATGERISPAWTVEHVTRWVHDIARRLPICGG